VAYRILDFSKNVVSLYPYCTNTRIHIGVPHWRLLGNIIIILKKLKYQVEVANYK